MNYSEYQQLAARTHNPELTLEGGRACYSMGLAGEASEVAEYLKTVVFYGRPLNVVTLIKELGDVHWYDVMVAKMFDIDGDEIVPVPSELDPKDMAGQTLHLYYAISVASAAGAANDYLKKVLFHGHAFDRDRLIVELGKLRWYLAKAAEIVGISEAQVIQANVDKLRARYPDGFSKAASQNRAAHDQ